MAAAQGHSLIFLVLFAASSIAGASRTMMKRAHEVRLSQDDSCPPEAPHPWETCTLLVGFDDKMPDADLDKFASKYPDSYIMRSVRMVSLPYGPMREECCTAQLELQSAPGVSFVDFDNAFVACDIVDGATHRESDDSFCKCVDEAQTVFCGDHQVADRKFDLVKVFKLCESSQDLHCEEAKAKCSDVEGSINRDGVPPPLCKCEGYNEKVFCGNAEVAERKFNMTTVKAQARCGNPYCAEHAKGAGKCDEVSGATDRWGAPPPQCKCSGWYDKVYCGDVVMAPRKFNLNVVKAAERCSSPYCAPKAIVVWPQ